MGVLFSAVTVTAGNKQSEFLVAGIPKEYGDLEGWVRFEEFMDELDEECTGLWLALHFLTLSCLIRQKKLPI